MTQPTLEDVRREVANYLADKWQASVAVVAIEQIFGGASRETYLLQLDV
ncbi:MAG: hypothetical protein ACJAXW_003731, partial [Candidatus Azotimanducaceae bacterium]